MDRLRILILVIVVAAVGGYFAMGLIGVDEPQSTDLPEPRSYIAPTPPASGATISTPTSFVLADEINLDVPFTPQAPHANWNLPYQEFCEEASAFMAAGYLMGFDIPDADFADVKLNEIKIFEEDYFGYYKDTTAEETTEILVEYYGIDRDKVELIYNPTEGDIKRALSRGRLVIVPAAGRQLGNPYFTRPGPLYHMLVIKGYTRDDKFITNDPGTRRGADYLYDPQVILDANHDWNDGDVENGQKVMIVVG